MRRAPPIVALGAPIWPCGGRSHLALIWLVSKATPVQNGATLYRTSDGTVEALHMHPVLARKRRKCRARTGGSRRLRRSQRPRSIASMNSMDHLDAIADRRALHTCTSGAARLKAGSSGILAIVNLDSISEGAQGDAELVGGHPQLCATAPRNVAAARPRGR